MRKTHQRLLEFSFATPKKDFCNKICYEQKSSLLIATDRQTNQLRPSIWKEAKCLTNLAKNPPGWKTPADLLSKLPVLFERRLSGQRYRVVLRARAAAHADRADDFAVDYKRIAAA